MAIAVADKGSDTEVKDILSSEDEIPFKYSITSYGADFTLDSLVRRIKDGSIVVPTFQRQFVWNQKQASLLIESFLMGLPVPGIFLSLEEDQTLLVIDGQQRLRTLQFFYEGIFDQTGREFALTGVREPFKGNIYRTLLDQDRRQLDNSILHATIVRQDVPQDGNSSIYILFERLNTQGVQLHPQEIRNCMYRGPFNDTLNHLNGDHSWRHVFGRVHQRSKDVELILRFLALYFGGEKYSRPMKGFLNDYMDKNRRLSQNSHEEICQAFIPTIALIDNAMGKSAFRTRAAALNAAVFDAVMVATARRLEQGEIADLGEFKQKYHEVVEHKDFVSDTESGTAEVGRVKRRLDLATTAFADVH